MTTLASNSSFIAYAKKPVHVSIDGVGTPVRPQIFVRHYVNIRIAAIKTGGRDGKSPDITSVTFDASSVDLTHDFSANIDSGDPLLAPLRAALEAGDPVNSLAIEHIRHQKGTSPLSPIHALRRAQSDGTQASSASAEQVRNIIASVNGQPSDRAESDHDEWPALLENRRGAVAPSGWEARIAGEDDWESFGYLAKVAAPEGLTSIDGLYAALKGLFDDLRAEVLDYTSGAAINPADTGADIGRRTRPGSFAEGKPWDARTSDGRVNLGGYAPSRYRLAFRDAREMVASNQAIPMSDDAVWRVAETLLRITDRVQAETYAHDTAPDRTSASYAEAAQWVRSTTWDLANVKGTPAWPSREENERDWVEQIAAVASERFAQVRDRAGSYLASKAPSKQRAGNARAATPPANPNLSANVLNGLASTIELYAKKRNPEALANLARVVREKDQAAIPFSARQVEGIFEVRVADATHATAEGWRTMPVLDLLKSLHDTFAQGAQQAQADRAPSSGVAPAGTAPTPAPAPAEATRARAKIAEGILVQLTRAQSLLDVQSAYLLARDSNVLDEPVVARRSNMAGIAIDAAGASAEDNIETVAQAVSAMKDFWIELEKAEQQAAAEAEAEAAEAEEYPSSDGVGGDGVVMDADESSDDDAAPRVDAEAEAEAESVSDPSGAEPAGSVGTSQAAEPQASNLATPAQMLADRAQEAATGGDVGALLAMEAEAREQDLTHNSVTANGSTGALGMFLGFLVSSSREGTLAAAS